MSVDKEKPMGAYPVTLTDGGFVLNGHEFSAKPTLGQRGQSGQRAYAMPVKSGGTGRQWVIVSNGKERRRLLNPYNSVQSLQIALWPQTDGSPYGNRGPIDSCAPPNWGGTITTIGTMPRYYWDDALQTTVESGSAPDIYTLLSYEGVTLLDSHPSTELGRVAAMVSLYDGTGGSIIGYLLREWEDQESGWTQTGEWLHLSADPLAALPTNNAKRRSGYLFYDKASDTYTIAGHDGLILCTRDNEPTPSLGALNSADDLPPNSGVAIVGKYALVGAHRPNGTLGCYYRDNGNEQWHHLADVELSTILPDCDHIQAHGDWDPQASGDPDEVPNSRWPYFAGEWYVWVTGRAGDPGPADRPTVAKAKLLAIRAATGSVRVVETYDAPLELLYPYDDFMDELETRLTYQSTHHPENWELQPFPIVITDTGHPKGWSTGSFSRGTILGSIPEEDWPTPEEDWSTFAQQVIRYQGLTTDRDPTVAPDSQRLECRQGLDGETDYPRGCVDTANSRIYFAVRHLAWHSSEDPDVGAINYETDFSYQGNYTDFGPGIIPGWDPTTNIRVFSIEANASGSASWAAFIQPIVRCVLRKYSTNALLDTLDLTREFSEIIGDYTYRYYQSPSIYEMAVTPGYLWILAKDWWAYGDQRITLILVDTDTMTEVDRVEMKPGTGRLLMESAGRPILMVGTDETGPWAEVCARWTLSGWPAGEWVAQRVRIVDDELEWTQVAAESGTASNAPEVLTELQNEAVSPGRQFWINAHTTLTLRE